jgi:hypothetical protein
MARVVRKGKSTSSRNIATIGGGFSGKLPDFGELFGLVGAL